MNLDYYSRLDDIILEEVNVKQLRRPVLESDKGTIELVYDGMKYWYELNGKDVTTRKLMDILPRLLKELYA